MNKRELEIELKQALGLMESNVFRLKSDFSFWSRKLEEYQELLVKLDTMEEVSVKDIEEFKALGVTTVVKD